MSAAARRSFPRLLVLLAVLALVLLGKKLFSSARAAAAEQ